MSQNQKTEKISNQPPVDLDPEIIRELIRQQSQKLQLERDRLALDIKRMEQDGKITEQSLSLNAELLKRAPNENRKTIALWGVFGTIILGGFLGLVIYCLNTGKEQFLKEFLNWVLHIVGVIGGFITGRLTAKHKSSNSQNDPDVVPEVEIID